MKINGIKFTLEIESIEFDVSEERGLEIVEVIQQLQQKIVLDKED